MQIKLHILHVSEQWNWWIIIVTIIVIEIWPEVLGRSRMRKAKKMLFQNKLGSNFPET
jgi:hypothetical protein